MKEISEQWLKAAQDDLHVINKIISDEHLTHIVAFHSQQCIEKSFKAVIEEFEAGSFKIHNLDRLFEIIRYYVELDVNMILIEQLDKLYTDARYPGELGLLPDGKPGLQDAKKFYDFAKYVYETIKTKLEERD